MKIFCASCGIKENNDEDIKLKMCNACKSVRYCSVKCQKEHWPKHKKSCKKRAAELRDELLFKQPESNHLGDCPICFLPLPIEDEGSEIFCCCCNYACYGCVYVYSKLGGEASSKCPFCRKSAYLSDEQITANLEKRAEANDPTAIYELGKICYEKGDFRGAFKLISRSAKLGCAAAPFDLGLMYRDGHGVEKDEKKMVRSLEDAAISGHPKARLALSEIEFSRNRIERCMKHLIIGSKLGDALAVEALQVFYEEGGMSKEEFDAAISGHQAALEAMKSKDREKAATEKWGEK